MRETPAAKPTWRGKVVCADGARVRWGGQAIQGRLGSQSAGPDKQSPGRQSGTGSAPISWATPATPAASMPLVGGDDRSGGELPSGIK